MKKVNLGPLKIILILLLIENSSYFNTVWKYFVLKKVFIEKSLFEKNSFEKISFEKTSFEKKSPIPLGALLGYLYKTLCLPVSYISNLEIT